MNILQAAIITATGFLAATAQIPSARLELGAKQAQVQPEAVTGFNVGNYMNVVENRRALLELKPSILRFPAGNVGDDQDLNASSLKIFAINLKLLTVNGVQPKVVVQTRAFQGVRNDGKNKAEDAAKAARLALEHKIRVDYWSVGNEPNLYAAGAALFALQGVGPHGTVDRVPKATFYAFRHLKNFVGQALEVRTTNPDLWVHAAQQGNRLTLIAINTSTSPLALETGLAGWELMGVKGFTDKVVQDEKPDIALKVASSLEFAPRSLWRLVYRKLRLQTQLIIYTTNQMAQLSSRLNHERTCIP